MRKKTHPKRLTTRWLKRHGFTNGLWRLEEQEKARAQLKRRRSRLPNKD